MEQMDCVVYIARHQDLAAIEVGIKGSLRPSSTEALPL